MPTVGESKMDRDEGASEGIANWLLDLATAVKSENHAKVQPFFADDFSGELPPIASDQMQAAVPGVERLAWTTADAGARTIRRDGVEEMFRDFFQRWESFEHLRFKVKAADFLSENPVRVKVKVQLQIVALRRDGGPESMAVYWPMEVVAVDDEKSPWRIAALHPGEGSSTVAERPFFTEVSRSTGLTKRSPRFGTEGNDGFNWHGAAAADFDGDGDLDIFVPANDGNLLYANQGDGTFTDVAKELGVQIPGGGTGTVFFDFDDDGDQDLFVARIGTQMLFENRLIPDGKVSFVDISGSSGVGDRPAHGFGVAVADVDGDRDLDIFVASYNAFGDVMPNAWFDATNGKPNLLFENQGNGTFKEVSRDTGLDGLRWSYAAAFADYDRDGDPDLYVANDYGPNHFYRNDNGHFTDVAAELGIDDPGNGMGVAWGDYDNDGLLDLYVMNMTSTAGARILNRLFPDATGVEAKLHKLAAGNSLFRNNGEGGFDEVSKDTGGVRASWAWGGGFIDINNDGCDDIYIANGFITGKSAKDT